MPLISNSIACCISLQHIPPHSSCHGCQFWPRFVRFSVRCRSSAVPSARGWCCGRLSLSLGHRLVLQPPVSSAHQTPHSVRLVLPANHTLPDRWPLSGGRKPGQSAQRRAGGMNMTISVWPGFDAKKTALWIISLLGYEGNRRCSTSSTGERVTKRRM